MALQDIIQHSFQTGLQFQMANCFSLSMMIKWLQLVILDYIFFQDPTRPCSIKRRISTRQLIYCYDVHSFLLLADVDTQCKEFDNGTSLHIAASNLCLEGAKCLVSVHLNNTVETLLMAIYLQLTLIKNMSFLCN